MTTPPAYGIRANPDLLPRIPLDARAILDVGCGAGGLGAAWRRRNPHTRLIAVEPDAALAAEAEPHYDEIHRLDIEAGSPPVAEGSLDALVFGDVLEHLRDPWAVLRGTARLLAPDGVLVACVPNVEHWSFAARLLMGGWRYEETGLFDRTHLRWFTRDGMHQALVEAGLVPVDVAPRIVDAPGIEDFVRRISPALQALGVEPAGYARRAAPLQYVWRATRRRPARLAVVARTLRPVGGINEVRIHEPLAALASRPGVVARVEPGAGIPQMPPGIPGIIVLQRQLLNAPSASDYLRALRATGALIIQEFDDDPAHWPVIEESGHLAFRGVHAVQTSTPALRELFLRWNPEVAVFPNALATVPEPRNFTSPDRLTLFFGALNREGDIAPFLPALNAVLAEAGERLAVQVLHDRATFDALETPHKRFAPLGSYAEYQAAMAGCEIAFLPLRDTRFNRMKSDLKFVEAAAHRLCCIASPVVYGATIRDGETGRIVQAPDEFAHALRALLATPAEALRMAEAARAEVIASRLLARQAAARLSWYRSLIERRAELDAALLARVPVLGAATTHTPR